jgi:hypothetical protein
VQLKEEERLRNIQREKEAKERLEKEKIEAELRKGDVEKFRDLINDLEAIKTKYVFKSNTYIYRYAHVITLIDKIIAYYEK